MAETRAVALAVALRLLALVATSPAEAAGRYKTVTKTFSNLEGIQTPNSSITDRSGPASPYPSALSVAGPRQGRVLDVNLQINNYSHTCAEDLDVLLVGPPGGTPSRCPTCPPAPTYMVST